MMSLWKINPKAEAEEEETVFTLRAVFEEGSP